jgi:copper chaperone NosL
MVAGISQRRTSRDLTPAGLRGYEKQTMTASMGSIAGKDSEMPVGGRRARTRPVRFFLAAVAVLLALLPPLAAAGAGETRGGPLPAAQPVGADGRMHIGAADRCPVCAMTVKAHRKFASAIQLKDDTTFYFCATGCMIRAWMHPEAFLKTPKSNLQRCVVQDYFSGEHVDGRSVIWVAGSDVVGPMGPALVPLKNEKDLAAFRGRHGGRTTFRLDDLSDFNWERMTGKKAAPATP